MSAKSSSACLAFILACSSPAANPSLGTTQSDSGGGGQGGSDQAVAVGGDGGAGGATSSAVCPAGSDFSDLYGKLKIELQIGLNSYPVALDTGAPTTVFDQSIIDENGEGPYEVTIGGKTLRLSPADVVPDFQSYFGIGGIYGLVGRDVFDKYAFTIDYQRSVYWLDDNVDEETLLACEHVEKDPGSTNWIDNYFTYVPAELEGTTGYLAIDTGASFAFTESWLFDVLYASHPRPIVGGEYIEWQGLTFWSSMIPLGTMSIAGKKVKNILSRTGPNGTISSSVDPTPFLGLAPSGFLRHFLITMDYPNERLRLDRYLGDSGTDTPSRYFVGVSLLEYKTEAIVAAVLDGSSAAEQGILPGDVVKKVDGVSLSSSNVGSWFWALTGTEPGQTRTLTIARYDEVFDVDVETGDLLLAPEGS